MTEPQSKTDELLAAAARARKQNGTAEEWETPHRISDPTGTPPVRSGMPASAALMLEYHDMTRQDDQADFKALVIVGTSLVLAAAVIGSLVLVTIHSAGWGWGEWRLGPMFLLLFSALALVVSCTIALRQVPPVAEGVLFGEPETERLRERLHELTGMSTETWYHGRLFYAGPAVAKKMEDLKGAVSVVNLAVALALMAGLLMVAYVLLGLGR